MRDRGKTRSATVRRVGTAQSVLEHGRNVVADSGPPSQRSRNWHVTPHQKAIEEEKRNEQEGEATENEYEVEDLLDSRISRKGHGRLEYLVKWKNYLREDASWEPKDNLAGAQEIVDEFHKKFPNAPRRIRKNDLKFRRYENFTKPDIPKTLYGWEDSKFECEYLEKLERQWQRWKQRGLLDDESKFARMQTLQRG